MADTFGAILLRFYKYTGAPDDFDIPFYSEQFTPKPKELTAEEIKNNVVRKLLE